MPDGRHARIERLFQKAAELPPADRRAFLESECDDAEVRGEVEKVLAYDEVQAGGLTGPLDDRLLPTRDLQQSAPGRGNVPLGVSPSGAVGTGLQPIARPNDRRCHAWVKLDSSRNTNYPKLRRRVETHSKRFFPALTLFWDFAPKSLFIEQMGGET